MQTQILAKNDEWKKGYKLQVLAKAPLRVVLAEVIDILGVLDGVDFVVLEVEGARSHQCGNHEGA